MTYVEMQEGLATGLLSVVNADHLRRLIQRNDERQTEIAQLRTALRETREALKCVAKPRPQLIEEPVHWAILQQKARNVLARHAPLAEEGNV